jgi:hypothetical protein
MIITAFALKWSFSTRKEGGRREWYSQGIKENSCGGMPLIIGMGYEHTK